jgi:hypothetical protein
MMRWLSLHAEEVLGAIVITCAVIVGICMVIRGAL